MAEHEQQHAHDSGDAHAKPHKKHHAAHGGHEEHEEGVPEWVVSFADNVLLQMGFFVILLAMNMGVKARGPTDEGDKTSAKSQDAALIDFAIAVREAFNTPVDLGSTKPEDLPLIKRILERKAAETGNSKEQGTTGDDKKAQDIRPGDFRTPAAYVDFPDRSAELSEQAKGILTDAVEKIRGTRWMVEVRGHTSRIESTRDIEFSRSLAYQRAFAVGKFLAEKGLSWEQIRLTSSGDGDPLVPRPRTSAEYNSNQRVEILQLPELLPNDPFSATPAQIPTVPNK